MNAQWLQQALTGSSNSTLSSHRSINGKPISPITRLARDSSLTIHFFCFLILTALHICGCLNSSDKSFLRNSSSTEKPKPDENASVVDNPKNTTINDNAKPDGNVDDDKISSDENTEPENIDDIEYLPGNIIKLHEQEFGFHDGDIAGVVYTGEEYITGFKYVIRKWPDHKIPYIIDPSYSDKERRFIESSMRTVEKDTCIKFVNRTNEPYFLRVTNTKKGLAAILTSCMDRKVISHVLLHAVGFWHEHNRVGRKKKLSIKYQSVRPEKIVYFQVLDPEYDPFHYLRYDQNSIMHYPPYAWGKPEQSTMLPSNFLASAWIGKTRYMTNDDKYKVKQLYGCLKYPKITSEQAA
ncbi:Zinc metalloproteinase nas-7 [Trichinella spiralis]|uniref:Metalloendopeptidase n=1 Tax=Trichinella spiralis TaxID=6334 RepID=A0ABR3KV24_TRISP